MRTLDKFRIDIAGLSETRLTGFGTLKSEIYHILYSGLETRKEAGVAMALSNRAKKCLVDWEPIGERILRARFATSQAKLTVIVVYAPTNDACDRTKDDFYRALSNVVAKTHRHDIVTVCGDFNAKVGGDASYAPTILGKHGLGEINDNGVRLIDFCATHELIVGATWFPHKQIHKYTWNSPDGVTRNEIDHILIERRRRRCLEDVRTFRGADCYSDHQLAVAKFKLKLKTVTKPQRPVKTFNLRKLQDPNVLQKYTTALSNKFSLLRDEVSLDSQWEKIAETVKEVAQEVVGYNRKKKEQWISESSWDIIDQRAQLKILVDKYDHSTTCSREYVDNLKAQYKRLHKQVKAATRDDKRMYLETMAEQAEAAARRGDSRTVYAITKQLAGISKASSTQVESKDGILLTQTDDIVRRWKEHFSEVLNQMPPTTTLNIPEEPLFDLGICSGPLILIEVKEALKTLKNGKAAGNDGISPELLKYGRSALAEPIFELLSRVWDEEKVPSEWSKAVIVKLFKKGQKTKCDNWRGIALQSVGSKVLCQIILNRIQSKVEKVLRDEQHGFRQNRSCCDLIFSLRVLLDESNEWQVQLLIVFIDFLKAFDSIHRGTIWKILVHYGIPTKIVNIIKALYHDIMCAVQTEGGLTEWFSVQSGVRQGCILSPLLFAIVIDFVLRGCSFSGGIQLNPLRELNDGDFADDVALITHDPEDMQRNINELGRMANAVGLSINANKTKSMSNAVIPDLAEGLLVNNEEIEEVREFKYLGSILTQDANSEREILCRITLAGSAFSYLRNVWRNNKYSQKLKLKIYNSNVVSVLMYGCETWSITAQLERRLQAFDNNCLRSILNIHWTERIRNDEIYRMTNHTPILDLIRKRRWMYWGHMVRMGEGRLPHDAWCWTPPGLRKSGRPKMTLGRSLMKEAKLARSSLEELWLKAQDRSSWRITVAALCAPRRRRT